MRNIIDFTGKKILVIGASSGIGKQTALTLSRLGASLLLSARRREKLEEALSALAPGEHSIYPADFSELDTIEALFKQIAEAHGALDGMVYAAGIRGTYPLQQLKPEKLQAVFDANFFGFIEATRQITRRKRYNPGMRIVTVSSIASLCGDKAHTAYSASKAAMDAAVRCLAKELAEKGVCINAVAPAMTATEMYTQYLQSGGGLEDGAEKLLERQYLGVIQPEDVANTIAFLLSPAAHFITGITLPVDGGLTTS